MNVTDASHDVPLSSALPYGSIRLFSPRTQPTSLNLESDGQTGPWVVPAEATRQSTRGWTELMRDLIYRLTTPRIRRCGLIGYTTPSILQEALDWENSRVSQVDAIQRELDRRDRAYAIRKWEQNYATACWIRRGWAINTLRRAQ